MKEQIYHQPGIKQKMWELLHNAGSMLTETVAEKPPIETTPASITYYSTGELEQPQEGQQAA